MAGKTDPPLIDGPPPMTNKDLPKKSEPWENVQLPIDILLLAVKDCESLKCLSFLNNLFRSYHIKLGKVYFGSIGDERMLLNIALIKCDKGSSGPGGSTVVVKNAVDVLGPRAVFCVGFCGGLNSKKVKLGDVVVSAKLITYAATKVLEDGIQERGVRVPVSVRISKLITGVADGWEAPLKDPKDLDVVVHRDGVFLSGPEVVDNKERRQELIERFPDAIAIEMEGEGLFAAAHDVEVPWIIIKGVSDFADGKKTKTSSWRPFASAMSASVVENLLNDSIVFRNWPHCGNEYAESRGSAVTTKRRTDTQAAGASAEYAEPDPKRPKLTAAPTDASVKLTVKLRVKSGQPTDKELEKLSHELGTGWKSLAHQLIGEKSEAKIQKYDLENPALEEKAYQMLLFWKRRDASAASYQVLFDALSDGVVNRVDLAKEFCLADKSDL